MPASFAWASPAYVGLAVWNLFTLVYRGPTRFVRSDVEHKGDFKEW